MTNTFRTYSVQTFGHAGTDRGRATGRDRLAPKMTFLLRVQAGKFVELGVLDVMQIFGRAGRPQFDTSGEGAHNTATNE